MQKVFRVYRTSIVVYYDFLKLFSLLLNRLIKKLCLAGSIFWLSFACFIFIFLVDFIFYFYFFYFFDDFDDDDDDHHDNDNSL